jgi:hypothetical protein
MAGCATKAKASKEEEKKKARTAGKKIKKPFK